MSLSKVLTRWVENAVPINWQPLHMGKGTEEGDAENTCWRAGHLCGRSRPKVKRRQESGSLKAESPEMLLPSKFLLQATIGSCAR